jgi:hypothetical protein
LLKTPVFGCGGADSPPTGWKNAVPNNPGHAVPINLAQRDSAFLVIVRKQKVIGEKNVNQKGRGRNLLFNDISFLFFKFF